MIKKNKTQTLDQRPGPRIVVGNISPIRPAGRLGVGSLVHDILRRRSQLDEFHHLLIVSAHTETMTWSSMFFLLLCVLRLSASYIGSS